ncbi:MAG: hypothetical protein RJB13_679 [Pseudomonadota bacterium]
MNKKILITCFFSIVFGLMACVSAPHAELPKNWLISIAGKMKNVCKLKVNSGFSADIILNNAVSSQVEAIWDSSGRLSGQLINSLGEDYLSFQIDEFGQFKTNQEIDENQSLFQALELLARIGSLQTRYLLCSGLFVSDRDEKEAQSPQLHAVQERTLAAAQTSFHLKSFVSRNLENSEQVLVKSKVSTDNWLFRKSIAEIDWKGQLAKNSLQPISLAVSSDVASIRLSFRDFD